MKLPTFLLKFALLAAPLFAACVAQAQDAVPAKPDLAKGQASFEVCVACHAADGNATLVPNPKLAQQHPEYLIKQLEEFKSGKRTDPAMAGMAALLSEEDVRNVAWWLASQKATPGLAKDKELVALGERIYRGGIQERNIAACAGCHSPNGAGIPSQYPRLSGQHAEYTIKQLTDFRDGKRGNNAQMRDVAAKLNDVEVRAVADYIAGLR